MQLGCVCEWDLVSGMFRTTVKGLASGSPDRGGVPAGLSCLTRRVPRSPVFVQCGSLLAATPSCQRAVPRLCLMRSSTRSHGCFFRCPAERLVIPRPFFLRSAFRLDQELSLPSPLPGVASHSPSATRTSPLPSPFYRRGVAGRIPPGASPADPKSVQARRRIA